MMKRRVMITCVLILLASTAGAVEDIDTMVGEYLRHGGAPGASVAVIRDQEVIHQGSYGQASVELSVPATRNTVYQIHVFRRCQAFGG